MRNAHLTVEQTIRSLLVQTHKRWRAIVIDDASDPASVAASAEIINRCNNYSQDTKIQFITNDVRKWETSNVLTALTMIHDDEIACRLDADDWLTDSDALSIIDSVYEETKCDALWTMHRWGFTTQNISGPLPRGANPYVHPWVSSHLKTWRTALSRDVNDENYKNEQGQLVQRAGDQAIYLPVLHKARNRVFLPLVTYHYTIDMRPETFSSDDAKFQKSEAEFIRKRGFIS